MSLEEKLKNLPNAPGVYLHKDADGRIIYIGKARVLKNRVRSYFQSGKGHDRKTRELVKRIADLEFIVTDTEVEALVLESNLIKRHKPRYNVLLKDDKQYPHLKLTINEAFPRLMITRRVQRDGALYFGPYLPASLARRTIDLVHRSFQLRSCDIDIDGRLPRPCLEYHIKRCLGPCVKDLCAPKEYMEAVADVRLFLEGKNKELSEQLEGRMTQAAEDMRFELAAKYRDQRKTVVAIAEQQKMATVSDRDVDIFGYYKEGAQLALQLFTMREGKVVGRREFFWEDLATDDFEPSVFLSEVLTQYYSTDYVPREVHVPTNFEDREILEQALTERKQKRVHIMFPQRGAKRDLIDLVEKNAKIAFEQRFRVLKPDTEKILNELKIMLDLPTPPTRVESFDISHIQGADTVAAMVVFDNGVMNRAENRRYKIKTVEGTNDFAAMREVVFRRYRRAKEEASAMPDLILIDGGKGQLSSAGDAMRELDLEHIPMMGVVKPQGRHADVSHLIIRGREHDPVPFDGHLPALRFIQKIRDETHKAAISYHRKRREIRDFTSELTAIPGVGEKRKTRLLRNFGSITRIAKATAAELSPFVGRETAEAVFSHFKDQRAAAGVAEIETTVNSDEPSNDASSETLIEAQTHLLNAPPSTANSATSEVDLLGDVHDVIEMAGDAGEPLIVETSLVDPEGEAEDLQPVRSIGHNTKQPLERRKRKPNGRALGNRSTNPFGVKREKMKDEDKK